MIYVSREQILLVVKRFYRIFLQIPEIGPDGYCPFLDRMRSRYNRVSGDSNARALKEQIKIHNLDKMRQESKEGPLHGFQSCKWKLSKKYVDVIT